MNKFKAIIIFIIIGNLFGNDGFYIPETNAGIFEFIILSSTNPHSSNTCFQEKHSIGFSYPGFYSPIGEFNWFYKNSNKSSYHLGIGYLYITFGLSKNIYDKFYFNANIGGLGNIHNIDINWSSIGISKNNKITDFTNIEYYFDLNFYRGIGAIFYGIPLNRGISIGGNYIKKINKKIQVVFGAGLSINQFRQHKIEFDENWEYSKTYNYKYKNYDVKNRWKLNVQPLIKFSINYDI